MRHLTAALLVLLLVAGSANAAPAKKVVHKHKKHTVHGVVISAAKHTVKGVAKGAVAVAKHL